MRKFYSFVLLAVTLLLSTNMEATVTATQAATIATVGEKSYSTLAAALQNSTEATPAVLQTDLTSGSTKLRFEIKDNNSYYLDLNGHTLYLYDAKESYAKKRGFRIEGGKLTITGTGTIRCRSDLGFYLLGSADENASNYTVLNIGKDVTIENGYSDATWPIGIDATTKDKCYGIVVNFAGTLKSTTQDKKLKGYGFTVNGQVNKSTGNVPVFNIEETAVIQTDSMAIYAAGYAIWNIKGRIESKSGTGIYAKAGIINVDGGTIIANGAYAAPQPNGNGSNETGDAIILDSKTGYAGNMQLKVTGNAYIESKNGYAIHEAWTDETTSKAQTLAIESGVFIGGKDNKAVHLSDEFRTHVVLANATVTGGIFNSNVADAMDGIVPATTHATTEVLYYNGQKMYIVHPTTSATDINDNNGQNADKSFTIQKSSSITNTKTTAYYVEVTDNAILTIGNGKTLTIGDGGLVVAEKAQIIVEVGGTLKVGKNGVIAANAGNILVKADANGAGEFLIAPDVTFNTKPYGTVELYTTAGIKSDGTNQWERFGSPVTTVESFVSNPKVGTAIYKWDNSSSNWVALSGGLGEIKPFTGFALTNNQTTISPVTYSIAGELVGNADSQIDFKVKGYQYLANSYTGYVHSYTMLKSVMNDAMQGTVWLQDATRRYQAVPMADLAEEDNDFAEIAPLETFVLQSLNDNEQIVDINYTAAIWNNPLRNDQPVSKAPQRIAETQDTYVRITVKDELNNADQVSLREGEQYSDAFDNGADATKLIENGYINFYATTEYDKQSVVASNKVCGTKLSLQTLAGTQFTMTFSRVRGTTYAIKDMQTNKVVLMSEENTYSFTTAANATEQDRFMIMDASEVGTHVEEIEGMTNHSGVWTMMGQYLGEENILSTLPAGVYIVNGQKIAK